MRRASNVSVGSREPFGTIEAYWDGQHEATFDTAEDFFLSKSLALFRNEPGTLKLEGDATEDLVVLHLFGDFPSDMTLVSKHTVSGTSDLEFSLKIE